jgi:hypothetical protein
MYLHPIEVGNYIELGKKNKKDSHGYIIKLKDLVDVKVLEETVGSIRKRQDLLLGLTFIDNSSDDSVTREQDITINIEDSRAHEIVDLLKEFKNMEEGGAYWTKSKITYTITNERQRRTEIYLETPFFAQDERILWMFMITENVMNTVIFIRVLTNFRILEYNYELHVGRAIALKHIEDVIVRKVVNKKVKSDQFGIFTNSDSTVDGNEKSITEIKSIGDVEFVTEEGALITIESVGNPDQIARIVKEQKEKIVSFETEIQAGKKIPNWKYSGEDDPFHILSLLGKECCAICGRVLGFMKYSPKKEWNIDGRLCNECYNNPTNLGVRPISSEKDSDVVCIACAKHASYFEFESENLCFNCFEQKYGKVLLTTNRAEYYGGHKVHLAGGVFSDYEFGKMYLTDIYLIFAKENKDISKRWEIIIPLSSVVMEQWDVKGESRRKQIVAGGASSGNIAMGGGVIHERGQRHRLSIPYVDVNGIVQQPVFGVSSFRGKDIRKWAEKLYELLVKPRPKLSQNIEPSETKNPLDILKLRFAKGEISENEFKKMRKIIET